MQLGALVGSEQCSPFSPNVKVMSGSGLSSSALDARNLLARHLRGSGVELGPGHEPFEVPFPAVSVRYVDRWRAEENQELFPELRGADFLEPDIVCDLSVERLSVLGDQSQDFVIASHVLEHLPEPLGILADIHRVLRPGGVALILLPDRRRTFDKKRVPTPLQHLVDEFEAGVTEVDDAHVLEFLDNAHGASYTEIPSGSPDETAAFLEWHRLRSVHVHCWHEGEFVEVLVHGVRRMGQEWELIEATVADDQGESGIEFGFVLRRDDVTMASEVRAERLEAAWKAWHRERLARHAERMALAEGLAKAAALAKSSSDQVERLNAALRDAGSRMTEMQAVIDRQDRSLVRFRRSPMYRVFRAVREVRGRSQQGELRRSGSSDSARRSK